MKYSVLNGLCYVVRVSMSMRMGMSKSMITRLTVVV
jgi:hypothetical protein